MKERNKAAARMNALSIFSLINATATQDFHTLRSSQVDELLKYADQARYQKPKNANGSRARYFFQKLQREAR